jgi:hypothetical protein
MSDNLHGVVKLLLARMESHPEEFLTALDGRWREIIIQVREYGSEEENDAIDAALRPIRLAKAHEEMMDELLNGDERRRIEEQEYERSLMNRTQNLFSGHQQQSRNTIHGVNPTHVWTDHYPNMGVGTVTPSQTMTIASTGTGTEAMRVQANGGIKIGNETLSEGLLKQIKKALNI